MIRGTRILLGDEARRYRKLIRRWEDYLINSKYEKGIGFEQIILPSVWEQETFVKKAGSEILEQMYAFKDKGDRDICLIPEVTAIIREEYLKTWAKSLPKPVRLFYTARCYRYERPQAGRQREFTQFGVEVLGDNISRLEVLQTMTDLINEAGLIDVKIAPLVKRGLDYYIEDGFEASVDSLGAQKQIAGGGRYDCGVGFAFGVERVLLALEKQK